MSELHHECGVAAVYHLPGRAAARSAREGGPDEVSRLMPRMLLDIQNRGQLAAGMTTFNPGRNQLLDTYKDVGTVSEVFRLSHRGKAESLMRQYAGRAAIGHVRYATCGADDRSYAQPFERHHLQKHKWFASRFNGQLANYQELRRQAADRRRPPPGPRDRHRNHHARDQPRAVGRPPAAADRRDADGQPAVRRRLQPRAAQRPGRHAGRPRSAGDQAAVLRDRRARCSPRPARAWRC